MRRLGIEREIYRRPNAMISPKDQETLETPMEETHLVVTLLVNWNGYSDTIECLESLFASDYPNQVVVIVDNGSTDGSLAKLMAWARERKYPKCTGDLKPLRFAEWQVEDLAGTGTWNPAVKLIFIDAKRNHGFAGGVNIGLKFALANRSVQYVWILNNDTIVAPDCLSRMKSRLTTDSGAGMCGSRLVYWQTDIVQAFGGAQFNPWLARTRLIGNRQSAHQWIDEDDIERRLHHLSGASMLVTRRFIEDVGPMDEGYFLYFEEMDWVMRGQGRYRLRYADRAIAYHKDGASTSSASQGSHGSPISAFFMIRSRLRFTRKFHPWALPTVTFYCLLLICRAWWRGQVEVAVAMSGALVGLSAEKAIGWNPNRAAISGDI